ncbi:hypothetical protein A33M_4243 [Rhodovulum sp. PH10]|uniref:hypothetical protein n=1 Tax=Rhodovulum sp. PH10 TaxID=1187851 RepID=UPI00027C2B9E|nr:hypothetical protein [Rhodovulum sp. PH10]EJW10556.1 hypothetical protein A33M_4243 [Rhodovulum sp. PH10]
MTHKPPPVPPENRSHKGPGDDNAPTVDDKIHGRNRPNDPDQQGQSANTRVNTHNVGYQQDR